MNSPKLLSSPNSGDTFYFRSSVPKDLLSHFGGIKQFRISLKCTIKSRSTRTTKILAKTISGIYEEIRQGMKSLDVEGEPNIYHDSGGFYKEVGRLWRLSDCEELSGSYSQEMMGLF